MTYLAFIAAAGGAPAWSEEAEKQGSSAAASDFLGRSESGDSAVDLNSDATYCVVGCFLDGAGNAGAAYIFARSGTTWTEQQRITASDAASDDRFGNAVAINAAGDTVAIGAHVDDNSNGTNAGSVYIFTRSGSTWTEQQRVQLSGGGASDLLGYSVDLSDDGDTLVVGAPGLPGSVAGQACVFTRSGGTWTQQQVLTASDATVGDVFGWQVAISGDGDTAAVGAINDDNSNGTHAGSVYIFTRSGGTWTQQQRVQSNVSGTDQAFGQAVSLKGGTGNTLAVGGPAVDGKGAVYIFTRSGSTWTQHTKITDAAGLAGDSFGAAVSLSSAGDLCIISSPNWDTPGSAAGKVLVYRLSGGSWSQEASLQGANTAAGDQLGYGVACAGDGTRFAASAPSDDTPASNAGSLLIFKAA